MGSFGVVVFVIIAILAALSNAKKAGQGTGAPRPGSRLPQRPGELPGRAGTPDVSMPQAGGRPAAELQRAADLVPDDLWAILTGERRPSMRQPQRPVETAHETALPAPPRRSVTEPVSLSQPGTAERAREERELLTQERTDLAQAMAAKATRQVPAAVAVPGPDVVPQTAAARVPGAGPGRSRGLISSPAELRRAIVLRTVLGPPKALE